MIRIQTPGLTLIQDTGRHEHTHVGVPTSGPFDAQRHAQARALLKLDTSAPLFEMFGEQFDFATSEQPVMFAVVGPADVRIDGKESGANHVLLVGRHDFVSIRRNRSASGPIYIALLGLRVPTTLGSASHDTFSKLGPAPVASGDEYIIEATPDEALFGRFVMTAKSRLTKTNIRVIPGPHVPEITWPLNVSVTSVTRSGVRLSTHETLPPTAGNLASLPVIPGTIQLPPSGEPIILGPDSGVTGGYPVLGVVITADLPLLARLTSNENITLTPVDISEAQAANWRINVTGVAELMEFAS